MSFVLLNEDPSSCRGRWAHGGKDMVVLSCPKCGRVEAVQVLDYKVSKIQTLNIEAPAPTEDAWFKLDLASGKVYPTFVCIGKECDFDGDIVLSNYPF